MHAYDHACLEDARALWDDEVCLCEVSKNAEGRLVRWYHQLQECDDDQRCKTLKTVHQLRVGVATYECDCELSVEYLDGVLAVPRLVTAFVDGDGTRRGLHAGDFEWFGNQVLVRGRLAGITNAGTHREPPFEPCQECHAPGYMEGRLCGRIIKARDDHLRGCRVTAMYRFRFEASTYFDDSPISGTIEGLIVCPCEDDA